MFASYAFCRPCLIRHVVFFSCLAGFAACGESLGGQARERQQDKLEATPSQLDEPVSQDIIRLLGAPEGDPLAVCAGRWSYTGLDCYNEARSPACGLEVPAHDEAIIEHRACEVLPFGVPSSTDLFDIAEPRYWSSNTFTLFGDPLPLYPPAHDKDYVTNNPQRTCTKDMQDWYNAKHLGQPYKNVACHLDPFIQASQGNVRQQVFFDGAHNRYVFPYDGYVTLTDPLSTSLSEDTRCPQVDPPKRVRVRDEIYLSCRHPSHGHAATNECGAKLYAARSAVGLRIDELPKRPFASSMARCSTCEPLPWSTGQQIVAKLACLRISFLAALQDSADEKQEAGHANLASDIAALKIRAATLFEETHTTALSPDDVSFAYAESLP